MFEKISKLINSRKKEYSKFSLHQSIPLANESTNRSKGSFLQADKISLYFNKTTDKRAEKVGQIKFVLNKGDKVIDDDPLLKLLNNPNALHPADKFWALYQKYYDLTGEVYILKQGGKSEISNNPNKLTEKSKVSSLWLLPSDKVEPKFDEDGNISKFIFNKGSGVKIDYTPEEIIYSFKPDPSNPTRGESIARSGIKSIEAEKQVSEYHSRVLANGGKVEGIFTFQDELNETQYEEMKDTYESKYAESQKSGMPMFLGGSAKYQNIGLSPDELSFLETKGVLLDDILIMTGVPKALLGSMADIKFSNAEDSVKIFLSETIKPLLDNLVDTLNRDSLTPDDVTLTYVDPTPQDIELQLKKAENGIKYRYMTVNEARALTGLDSIDGGDELPKEAIPQVVENKFVINNKDIKGDDELDSKETSFHPLREKSVRDEYGKKKDAQLMKDEDIFALVVNSYFKGQEKRIIDFLEPLKQFKKKDLIDETFNMALEVEIAKETFLPKLEELLIKYGSQAVTLANGKDDFSISGEIASFLDEKVRVFSEKINETTFNKLKRDFALSLEAGETRKELINRISDTYKNFISPDKLESRAKLIARTEVHAVSQYGTFKGYEQSNLETKIWVTVADERVRSSHASLDGVEIPINQYFSNGLKFPGDYNGSAAEVINCRCVI